MSIIADAVEAAAKPFWLRVLPYVAAVSVVGGALYGAYAHGCTVTENKWKLIVAQNAKASADAQTKAIFDARKEEQDSAAAQALIDRSLLDKANNEITTRDNTIAGLRTGTVRLRERFTCGSATSGVSKASTSASSGDAGAQRGLQESDAELLIRLASDADQVALQLKACQAVVKADRK